MTRDFSVRTAVEADVPSMHQIRCDVRENMLSDPARVTEASYAPFVESGSAWVAESGGMVRGFAAIDLQTFSVWALFIAPEYEGLGIGRELHHHMLHRARDSGARTLWLNTAPGTRAERFYVNAGWRNAGSTPQGELRLELPLHL